MPCLLGAVALLFTSSIVQAQDTAWAEKMFEKMSHDFGVVAKGADARYRLAITNKYVQTVHISNVRTSCGCASASASVDTLQSRETGYIDISMDTRRFENEKKSTVIVTLDAPLYAEIRIPVQVFIRTDVVLIPGAAEFGAVPRGKDQDRKISVAYAGRNDWQIKNVINKNSHLEARVVETSRSNGRVNYDLHVHLKPGAPIGDLRDQIVLVTDDPSAPQIPVLVEARVEAEFTVNPDVVSFGVLNPGEKKTMNVVVRGRKPFNIEKIESEKISGAFEVRLPQDARVIHVLPLTFTAPADGGTVNEEFTITIPGEAEPVHFRVYGKVNSATADAQNSAAN